MFGYIRVHEDELKIHDYGVYKGVYCGLCKTMNKNTGHLSPLTLTYDFVLLALLRSYVSGEGFTVRPGKCIAHPIKKRPIAKENEALEYCSAVSAVLTYYKLLDDKNDRDTKKRIISGTALRQARHNMKKAIKRFPQYDLNGLASKVSKHLSNLSELENAGCDSADSCAHVFGMLLGDCFAHCINDGELADNCYQIGYHVGRWIYLIDLCDDFEKDRKTGAFNPLVISGYSFLPETLLRGTLERESILAFEEFKKLKVTFTDIYSIIENILCHGMHAAVVKVFEKTDAAAPNKAERTENE